MKKITLKSILFCVVMLFSLFLTAQDIYRIKNLATGKFLTDAGVSEQPVTLSDTGDAPNTHWTFIENGALINIDSQVNGLLSAPDGTAPTGAYVILSTDSTTSSNDNTWTVEVNSANNTYRFISNLNRYLYHDTNDTVTHVQTPDILDRSYWELILYVPPEIPVDIPDDEDTGTDLDCPASGEFENNNTRNVDIQGGADNVGTVDDRTCYSDYSETNLYGKTWGVYNITRNSNHWDAPNTLQPRIERSMPRSGETGVGSFAKFTGTFRILEVGDAGSFGQDGSYIAQAKGKHTGGGGPPDPAICLYRAHPVYGTGINADKQIAFDIYAERILERGGSGSGREVVFLKRVDKDAETSFELEIGFAEDPTDSTKKIHYCNAVIGGEAFNWNIPDPERGTESGIRYGAYRVRGGRAQIRWAETTYQRAEVEDNGSGSNDDNIFRMRNVATGEFLTDSGVSAMPVTMTSSGEATNTHWTFVQNGEFFNIDSETSGILRATGPGFSSLPYAVVSTGTGAPSSDSDKVWTVTQDFSDDTYRFEAGTSGRYLYHQADGSVTNISAPDTDNRSKWEVIALSESLNIEDNEFSSSTIKVFPNPAKDTFTISLNNLNNAQVKIFDLLGKIVYENQARGKTLKINNDGQFKPGVYIIKVMGDNNKVYHTRLMVK